ncbi:MAG: alcohol dehydrogenase catalytic domain-containing protein [Eubacteriales bacterium]|nr:alcohol dehydrogenase catalytic domain-containing protein [Eubacteriales bacterium]
MKALVMTAPRTVELTELPTPVPGDDEILIRIRACGICMNDMRDYAGNCSYSYPRIGGHEFSGDIVAMGKDVNHYHDRFHIGQRVVSYIIDNCGQCYHCKNGFENVCPDFAHTDTYLNPGGISGFKGFSQYYLAKANDVYICNDEIPYEQLAMVEPLACVLTAVNRGNPQFGDDVLIIGGGSMGLMFILMCKLKGVRIIVSEPREDRRKKALELGADIVIDPLSCDLKEEIMRLTDGVGVQTVFDTIEIPELAVQAVDCASVCGTVVLYSSMHPNTPMPLDLGKIHTMQKTLAGIQNGSLKTFWQAVQLLSKKIVDISPVIDKVFDYKDIDAAMEYAMRPDTYKVVIQITD